MAKRSRARKRNPSPSTEPPAATSTGKGDRSAVTAAPSPGRKWWFRLLLALLVPTLLLAGLESGLRLAGYGYPTSMFLEVERQGVYGANRQFGWRFFPRAIARSPQFINFPVRKTPGTYRIFVLGASAAFGYPDAAFSFARYLEVMLKDRFPEVRFEVINTSMVAINSHVVLPIAKECARYEPDLFIVYLGNNEVIGPYGIGSSLTRPSGSLGTIRLGIKLRTYRLGQLMQQIAGNLSGRENILEKWGGMQMFAENEISADDPRLARVYEFYRQNLLDIRRVATGSGARVIFSTVATNLRDCAPFAAVHRADLAEAAAAQWNELFTAGVSAQNRGDWSTACDRLDAAAALDDQYADLQYRLATCLLAAGDTSRAPVHFVRARELDALRFRADDRINAIIREVAGGNPEAATETSVQLVDAVSLLATHATTPPYLPGRDLFYEHVHLTTQGNYLLARSLWPQVVAGLPPAIRARGENDPEPPSLEVCNAELVLTEWNQYQMLTQLRTLLVDHPFTGQLDHDDNLAALDAELAALRERATPERVQQMYQAYVAAVARRPDDLLLRINYVALLNTLGNPSAAELQMQHLLHTQPPLD
ncbi:MAG: hypothetical protein ABIF77_20580 [bacterium]